MCGINENVTLNYAHSKHQKRQLTKVAMSDDPTFKTSRLSD
jgi:hypothetical protein